MTANSVPAALLCLVYFTLDLNDVLRYGAQFITYLGARG